VPAAKSAAVAPIRANHGGFVAKPAVAPLPGRRTVVAPVSSIAIPISFTRGSAELSAEAKSQANEFAAALTMGKLATRTVVIEGHTDSSGDPARNLDLSGRRAHAVADYLVSQHVDAARIKAVGYGSERPLAKHSASSPENRRVQFSFAD
jgi:outer membrane protein OmpA-like peptidoglycan-associated protein